MHKVNMSSKNCSDVDNLPGYDSVDQTDVKEIVEVDSDVSSNAFLIESISELPNTEQIDDRNWSNTPLIGNTHENSGTRSTVSSCISEESADKRIKDEALNVSDDDRHCASDIDSETEVKEIATRLQDSVEISSIQNDIHETDVKIKVITNIEVVDDMITDDATDLKQRLRFENQDSGNVSRPADEFTINEGRTVAEETIDELKEVINDRFDSDEICIDIRETGDVPTAVKEIAVDLDAQRLATVILASGDNASPLSINLPTLNTDVQENIDPRKEFQKDLAELYLRKHCMLPLSTEFPELFAPINRVYVSQNFNEVPLAHASASTNTDTESLCASDIFANEEARNIYIAGNVGTGKTTFCKHIAFSWGMLVQESTSSRADMTVGCYHINRVTRHLDQFTFVLFLNLKSTNGSECDIDAMISQQILADLPRFDLVYTKELVMHILSTERCLILLDSLESWIHPTGDRTKCERPTMMRHLPHRRLRTNCTIVSTIATWKMEDIQLDHSEIDRKFELTGPVNTDRMLTNYIDCLNTCIGQSRRAEKFNSDLKQKLLFDRIGTPMINTHLLCLWFQPGFHETTFLEVLCNVVNILLKKVQEKPNYCEGQRSLHTRDESKCVPAHLDVLRDAAYTAFLKDLARFAFIQFDGCRQRSTTSHPKTELSKVHLRTALESGLVVQNTKNDHKEKHSFSNKLFESFFIALHLNEQDKDFKGLSQCLLRDNLQQMSQVFLAMCGFVPQKAKHFAKQIAKAVRKSELKNFDEVESYADEIENLQTLLIQGRIECIQTSTKGPDFDLYCVALTESNHSQQAALQGVVNKAKPHTLIVDAKRENTSELAIERGAFVANHMCVSSLQALVGHKLVVLCITEFQTSSGEYLDASVCTNLCHLSVGTPKMLGDQKLSINVQITAWKLQSCNLYNLNGESTIKILSRLEEQAVKLETLTVVNCDCSDRKSPKSKLCLLVELCVQPGAENYLVDLAVCRNLKTIEVVGMSGHNIRIHGPVIQTCSIIDSDAIEHHVFDNIKTSVTGSSLRDLYLEKCLYPRLVCQALLKLTQLHSLSIGHCDSAFGLEYLVDNLPNTVHEIRLWKVEMAPAKIINLIQKIIQFTHTVDLEYQHSISRLREVVHYLKSSDEFIETVDSDSHLWIGHRKFQSTVHINGAIKNVNILYNSFMGPHWPFY